MDNELKQNLTASETWMRGLFILLFAFLLVVARLVTAAVVVIQFLFTVFSGKTNDNLRSFGASLARFVYQSLLFVTYNTDNKPFPFGEWPATETSVETVNTEPTKAKPEARPKAKPKAKPKTKPKAKAKPKTETEPAADAGVTQDATPDSPQDSTDTKPEA